MAVPIEETTAVLTVDAPPTYRNSLVAVIGQQSDANPIVSSIVQTGTTWTRLTTAVRTNHASVEIWAAQNIQVGVASSLTFNLNTAAKTSIAVIEYEELKRSGTLVDRTANANQDSQAPTTGQTTTTTQADELWLGGISCRPDGQPYQNPSNDFDEILQAVSSVPDNLLLHLTFDGTTEEIALRDNSPNGVSIFSTNTIGMVFGEPGYDPLSGLAVKLTGTYDGAAYGPDPQFNRSSGAIALRVKATLPITNGLIFAAANATSTEYISLQIFAGFLGLFHHTGPSVLYPAATALGDGNWHEVVGTWSEADDNIRLIVDGVELGNDTGLSPWAPTTDILYLLGGYQPLSLAATPATFDEARVTQTVDWTVPFANVRLGLYEKIVNAIGQADVTVQTDRSVNWVGGIVTLFSDTAVDQTVTANLSAVVVDAVSSTLDLNVAVAGVNQISTDLTVNVAAALYNWLQVLVGGTARFADLDVLVDPQTRIGAGLDVTILGLDEPLTVEMDLFVTLLLSRFVNLDVYVTANDLRLTLPMDVGVLVLPAISNITTTPEDYQYLHCRPLWCNVPKMRRISTFCQASIMEINSIDTTLNMHVVDTMYVWATCQVLIEPAGP